MQILQEHKSAASAGGGLSLESVVVEGTLDRLVLVLMTAATAARGLTLLL